MLTSGDDPDHDITRVNLVKSNSAFRIDLQSNPGSLFLKNTHEQIFVFVLYFCSRILRSLFNQVVMLWRTR